MVLRRCVSLTLLIVTIRRFADKDAVEKRLYVLQQQGYIYATEPT